MRPTILWKVDIAPDTWHVRGPGQQLTTSTEEHYAPSLAADGRLVFGSYSPRMSLWSLPADTDDGVVRRTASSHARCKLDRLPTVSLDGESLAFARVIGEEQAVFVLNSRTGVESERVGAGPVGGPSISPDGSKLAYGRSDTIELVSASGSEPERLTADGDACSPEGGHTTTPAYCTSTTPRGIASRRLEPEDRPQADPRCAKGPSTLPGEIFAGRSMGVRSSSASGSVSASGWSELSHIPQPTPARGSLSRPIAGSTTSPGGHRTGACSTSSRTATASGASGRSGWMKNRRRPVGAPFAVYHMHGARLSMMNAQVWNLGFDVARDRLIFNMGERTGNIWTTTVDPHR